MGTHEHLSILFLDARFRCVDILNGEVIQPERDRGLAGVTGHHAADRRAAIFKDPVNAHWAHVHDAFLSPTEQIGVEGPCAWPVVGRELVPADCAWGAGGGPWRCIIERSFEHEKGRALWILNRGPASDGWNVLRWAVQFTSRLLQALGIRVHVIDADEASPAGLHTGSEHIRGQLHEAGGAVAAD